MKYVAYHYNQGDAKLNFSFQPDAPVQLKIDFLAILLQAAEDIKNEINTVTTRPVVTVKEEKKEEKPEK